MLPNAKICQSLQANNKWSDFSKLLLKIILKSEPENLISQIVVWVMQVLVW